MTHPPTLEERLSLLESNLLAAREKPVSINMTPQASGFFGQSGSSSYSPLPQVSCCQVPECEHTPSDDDETSDATPPVFDDGLIDEAIDGAYQALAAASLITQEGSNTEIIAACQLLTDFALSVADRN